ncbi:MAG: glycosyl transferase family protein [Novosphingobium sp.]|nr:glycosyl transferase family protein [Novosphingobium sp.]
MPGSWHPAGYGLWRLLEFVEHELLLFAAVMFVLGSLDELVVDLAWLRLRLTGRTRPQRFSTSPDAPLAGVVAVLMPAWREADVVGTTLAHCRAAWPQRELRIYAGCYRNDAATMAALAAGAGNDPRIRIVVNPVAGPTTKADCLNRLYAALIADECRQGARARSVILHDAEDLVHGDALALLDRELGNAEFVQLPVVPEPQPRSRWVAGHYGDEFAEAHAKTMVVRDRLGVALPAAGVGCGISREALARLAELRGAAGPFAAECLTEDYELGLTIAATGGRQRFVRARAADGSLIATRELFPTDLGAAVRQKTRWMHGIAYQGWDRLGWSGRLSERWMRLRDRRGPLTALVLAAAYAGILLWAVLIAAELAGWHQPTRLPPALVVLLWINLAAFAWRAAFRLGFTADAYGWAEGWRAIARIPFANVIAIMAGRRATASYVRSLLGGVVTWDKTPHPVHASALVYDRRGRKDGT